MGCGKSTSYAITLDGVIDRGRGQQELSVTCCNNGQCLASALGVKYSPPKFHYARPNDSLRNLPQDPTPGEIGREIYSRYLRHGYSMTWCVAMAHDMCVALGTKSFIKEVTELYRLQGEHDNGSD